MIILAHFLAAVIGGHGQRLAQAGLNITPGPGALGSDHCALPLEDVSLHTVCGAVSRISSSLWKSVIPFCFLFSTFSCGLGSWEHIRWRVWNLFLSKSWNIFLPNSDVDLNDLKMSRPEQTFFPKKLDPCAFPPTGYEGYSFFTFLMIRVSWLLGSTCPSGSEVVYHCGFYLYF